MKFILGKKLKMGQIFDEKGDQIPVTLVEAGPCFVTQIKTKEPRSTTEGGLRSKKPRTRTSSVRGMDGYNAIQIGFEKIAKAKKIKKTMRGKEFKYLREFHTDESRIKNYELGNKIDTSIFKEGDMVSISGISKGKGFAGAVKRWRVAGQTKTHGTKNTWRTIGSVGTSTPSRVIKGKKMPGRMGNERVTVKNLKIVKIDPENNLIAVKGAIPGRKGTLLEIKG